MTTDRQIAANRLNAQKSTGPRTDDGKAASRLNALKHGLAATTCAALMADDTGREAVQDRMARWEPELKPAGEVQRHLFEQVVAASIRVQRCVDGYFALCRRHGERARDHWDEDRRVEADEIAARLAREPGAATRRLESTPQGCDLKLELWSGLAAHLDRHGDWTDPQRSMALDLLGVHPALREAETPVDPPVGDVAGARRAVVAAEVARLTDLRDGRLVELDARDRALAEATLGAEFTRPLQLLARYENACSRRQAQAWRKLAEAQRSASPSRPTAPPRPRPEPTTPLLKAAESLAPLLSPPSPTLPIAIARPSAAAPDPDPSDRRPNRRERRAAQRRRA